MKMFVVSFGYRGDYALTAAQATTLLAAMEPMRKVEQPNYSGPYFFTGEGCEEITEMRLANVEEPPTPPSEPDPLQITKQPLAVADETGVPF